ncbi:ABC transporter ATP-binding protein [uncultured Acetatifactor sp.]|uniref:ABC transporter ATP-binding protein n=1 Tax=uncultured Acetatifactor sp. TaxID=1671927 RepID=UPI0026149782|nr:ABC transporter ATP-binding protein [uncultured Acetatifactor sp.]
MNRYPEHHYAHPQPPLLSVQSVEKYYGSPQSVTKALDQVSFRIRPGEHIAVMGASGSGKTTLLNCISTIDTVSSGHILLEGRDITAIPMEEIAAFRREALGFVFQEFNLLDTLTLEENMALPLTIRELEPAEIRAKVHALADRLGLSEALGKFPYQVSGGQKQRCAFARAVIGEPKLILADEPTGSVKLVQHYPKEIPVILFSLSMRISEITDRHSVRFSSRVSDL